MARLRQENPISPLLYPDGTQGWLITRHATAKAVLADPRFSSRMELRNSATRRMLSEEPEPAEPGLFIGMDPPQHTHYRKLLTGQFSTRRMNQLRSRVEQIVAAQVDELERTGPPVDLVQNFTAPVPSLMISEILGVPYKDRAVFQYNMAALLSLTVSTEEMLAARHTLRDFVKTLVAAKRAEPTDDILGGLAGNANLNDDELTGICFLLLAAGFESTAQMLGLGTFALLTHPDQLATLRENPDLIDNAVEELLRYLTVVQFGLNRTALEDVDLNGTPIRAGQTITISLTAANRDPNRFPSPDRLDITRAPGGHLSFGHGPHLCLGQQLARMEMRAGYQALLDRFPTLRLAVPPEEVPTDDAKQLYGVGQLLVTWDA
ncbi:cytochrome P450 [Streptomyces sp. NL15-2K]|uniref:cytochrome P450 n=1 Tax=Streptomyces sp. NL15-2K TaxID=376149 RepID=UPI00209C536E|nr:cytochrome P450 [Streptomyces sp. NL15-2K]